MRMSKNQVNHLASRAQLPCALAKRQHESRHNALSAVDSLTLVVPTSRWAAASAKYGWKPEAKQRSFTVQYTHLMSR